MPVAKYQVITLNLAVPAGARRMTAARENISQAFDLYKGAIIGLANYDVCQDRYL